jgi:hypothetical protein
MYVNCFTGYVIAMNGDINNQEEPGLPDGVFSNQNSRFGKILEGLAMEVVGKFYSHRVNFQAILHILYPFGKILHVLVYF